MTSPSAPLLSPFIIGQIVGLSASGAWAVSSLGNGPFNVVTALEKYSSLSPSSKSAIIGPSFFGMGRPAFLASVALTAGGYLTAYFTGPNTTPIEHSRLLLLGAGTTIVALLHTRAFMVPLYKRIGDSSSLVGEGAEARWAGLVKRFYRGNSLRVSLFLLAYGCGVYGLAKTIIV
ncbi:hypothetical protein FRB94_004303 [Tulasnella sp. JGI-2019a]|nr:hypothetical protein FRB94_004303 [Tulasnella sp. JGI-2019a]